MNDPVKNAAEGLRCIDLLSMNEGGDWFLARIAERIAELEGKILDEDMPPGDRENLRQRRIAMKEILELPASLKRGFENNLLAAGVKPGTTLPL